LNVSSNKTHRAKSREHGVRGWRERETPKMMGRRGDGVIGRENNFGMRNALPVGREFGMQNKVLILFRENHGIK